MFRTFCVATLALGAVSGAQAALLVPVEGTVLVNRGDGFVQAPEITEVKAGDRVLVRGEGQAQIDYGDGCLIEVKANHSAVVGDTSGCDKAALYSTSSTSGAPATTGSLKDRPIALAPQQPVGPDMERLIMGGLLIAGGTAAIISNDDKRPASP
jgi:hypothetical protein